MGVVDGRDVGGGDGGLFYGAGVLLVGRGFVAGAVLCGFYFEVERLLDLISSRRSNHMMLVLLLTTVKSRARRLLTRLHALWLPRD